MAKHRFDAEVHCQGCCMWHRSTVHVTLDVYGQPVTYVLCLPCADRVEKREQERLDDERSLQASFYHP